MESQISSLSIFFSLLLISYLIANRLNFPVIPIYIVSGVLTSVFFHSQDVHIFEFLGVVFLLFFIGLEFSLAELERNYKSIISVGLIDFVLNFFPAFFVSKFLGFDSLTSLLIATVVYPSSSAIVSKLLIDLKKLANPEVEPVLSILVFEDLAAATLLAVLFNLKSGNLEPSGILSVLLKISLFILLSLFIIKLLRKVVDLSVDYVGGAKEFLSILVGTLLFGFIEFSLGFGLSEAIGAFVAGTLFGETSHKESVESLVVPFRDVFGALFFLSFGLSIDLTKMTSSIFLPFLVILTTSFLTKLLTGIFSVKFYGLSLKRGISAGLMLLPRGEFSILVAATKESIVPLSALYVLTTSLLGSVAVKESSRILKFLFKEKRKKSKLTKSQLLGD